MAAITRLDVTPRYSEAVIHAGTVYLAGQVPEATAATGDAAAQTREVLGLVDALLARAGSHKSRLLSATVYVRDMAADYAGMNVAWEEWCPAGHAPARATVQAALARPEWRVEVVVVAAQGGAD
jgi:enamine deaminase RidA (YjgF/YER057c/UK114 family)